MPQFGKKQDLFHEKTLELGREFAQNPEDLQGSAKEAFEGKRRELVPQAEELSREQANLGRQQAELGRRQGELGQEQSRLGK